MREQVRPHQLGPSDKSARTTLHHVPDLRGDIGHGGREAALHGRYHVLQARLPERPIEYLKKFGYSGEQATIILGTAPGEGLISGIVDFPNACCTIYIPTDIFDFDIRPSAAGPARMVQGNELATAT